MYFVFIAQIACWCVDLSLCFMVRMAVLLSNNEAVCFLSAKIEAVGLNESDAVC